MAKLIDTIGILIYIVLNIILFPLIVLVYCYIGFIISVKAIKQVNFTLPTFQFRFKERFDHFILLKGIKAITHSLQLLLVKR